MHHFASKEAIYRQILEDALADWGLRISSIGSSSIDDSDHRRSDDAGSEAPVDGWVLVDAVLEATFDFFRANPEIVSIVRREALAEKGHLGFDLGAALRPYFTRSVAFFEREMKAGRFRHHDAENLVVTGYGALLTYFSDHWMLIGLLERDPFSPTALEARFQHVRDFVHAALEPPATFEDTDREANVTHDSGDNTVDDPS